jgi:drug/metabolite transporter (DMT)-like permease
MRSLIGAIAGMFYFQGLKYLPLSEGVVLYRTSPIWTSFLAVVVLKIDRYTLTQFYTTVICFAGILLVARPPFI